MSSQRIFAARAAFFFVLTIIVGAFAWWFVKRPSFLLFQAYKELGRGNQPAVIERYKKLLSKKNITKEEEIRYRKELGEFYVSALDQTRGIPLLKASEYTIENPYVALARKEFDRILELDPTDSQAHYYIGRILWLQKLETYAMDELRLSRQYDPKNPMPVWYLAVIHQERGEATQAREMALAALAIKPDLDEAREVLIKAYAQLGEHQKAIEMYDQCAPDFRANPDRMAQHALYLAEQNRWPEAEALIERAEQASPQNGATQIFTGRLMLPKGDLDRAAGYFSQAAALLPHHLWPLVWQSVAQAQRGDCDDATRVSQKIVEGMPRWAWGRWAYAWSLLCRGEVDRASDELSEAIRLAPEFIEAIRLKTDIAIDRGRYDEAGKLIRPLLDKKIHQSEAYARLAESFYWQRNFSMAQEMAETALGLNPENLWARVWLALSSKNSQTSLEPLLAASQKKPVLRGWALAVLAIDGQSTALRELERLTLACPREAALWFLLGEAYQENRRSSDAVRAYQNAVSIAPYHLRAQLGLVASHASLGDLEKAHSALQAAAQINSLNKDVQEWKRKLKLPR